MNESSEFKGIVKKRSPKKLLKYALIAVGLLAVVGVVLWYVLIETKKPIVLDRPLIEKAVTAIDKNDTQALSTVADSIRKVSRFETSPEYLTILTISAIRDSDPSQASTYLNQLKALGDFKYVDYVPWQDRSGVIASLEHDVSFVEASKAAQNSWGFSGGKG